MLTEFNFQSCPVRVVIKDGEPWFVASDVCAALDHSNHRMVVFGLDEDEKGVSNVYTPGGEQRMLIVSESGLYSLILTSRKPEAIAFKRWVTHEVIPSIRRTGYFETGSMRMTRRSWLPKFVAFCDENSIDIGAAVRAMETQILHKREVFRSF